MKGSRAHNNQSAVIFLWLAGLLEKKKAKKAASH